MSPDNKTHYDAIYDEMFGLRNEILHNVVVLNNRNQSLARALILMGYPSGAFPEDYLPTHVKDFHLYEAKRGKKTAYPIRVIVKLLNINPRQAQVYSKFFDTVEKIRRHELLLFSLACASQEGSP